MTSAGKKERRWLRRLGWLVVGLSAVVAVFVALGWRAFGEGASGARLERMRFDLLAVDLSGAEPLVEHARAVF